MNKQQIEIGGKVDINPNQKTPIGIVDTAEGNGMDIEGDNETTRGNDEVIGSEIEAIEHNKQKEDIDLIQSEKDYDIIHEVNMDTPGHQEQNRVNMDDDVVSAINETPMM